jgi:hypothetical protein
MAVRTELNGRTVALSPVAIDVFCMYRYQSKYASAVDVFLVKAVQQTLSRSQAHHLSQVRSSISTTQVIYYARNVNGCRDFAPMPMQLA